MIYQELHRSETKISPDSQLPGFMIYQELHRSETRFVIKSDKRPFMTYQELPWLLLMV